MPRRPIQTEMLPSAFALDTPFGSDWFIQFAA